MQGGKYSRALEVLENYSNFSKQITESIKLLNDKDFSFEEIYTALHKFLDILLYEYEIEVL